MKEHKDHPDVKISPPVLLLFHLFAAFILNWLVRLPFAFPKILEWIGYALVIIGLGLAFNAVSRFRRAHTTVDPHGSVNTIVTSGPYRFTRNPIYLGFTCFLIGFLFIFKSYWGLILSPILIVLMNMLVIQYEEAYLEKKFKDVYASYKLHVRRWL